MFNRLFFSRHSSIFNMGNFCSKICPIFCRHYQTSDILVVNEIINDEDENIFQQQQQHQQLEINNEYEHDIDDIAPISTCPPPPLPTPSSTLLFSNKNANDNNLLQLKEPLLPNLSETSQPIATYCDYALLADSRCQQWIKQNKLIIIIRGVPGSGKSFLVKQLIKYLPESQICSADHYFQQSINDEASYAFDASKLKQAHNQCQNKAFNAMQNGASPIIIDNTHVRTWEYRYYTDLSKKFNYLSLVLTPKTPWRFDAGICAAKNQHNVPLATLEKKIQEFEPTLPLYFGWFLAQNDANQLTQLANDLWKSLLLIDDVIGILTRDFKTTSTITSSGKGSGKKGTNKRSTNLNKREINNLKNWFTIQQNEPLHVTAKFCLHGRANGAREYCNSKDVWDSQGCLFPIEVTSILITPRTIAAVVKLPDNVLPPNGGYDALSHATFPLWQNEDNQMVNQDGSPGPQGGASRPPGSRAHITLALASGIQAVQAGLDVLQLWDINHRRSPTSSPSSAASDDNNDDDGGDAAFCTVTQWGTVQSFTKGFFSLQLEPPRLLDTLFAPRF